MSNDSFSHRVYWKKTLAGLEPQADLLLDYTRTESKTELPRQSPTYPVGDAAAKINKVAGNASLAKFIVLLAGVNVLLFKSTGNADIVLGIPPYKREGDFLLPLRANILEEQTFNEILLNTRHAVTGAYSHQDLPVQPLPTPLRVTVRLQEIHHDLPVEGSELLFSFSARDGDMRLTISYLESLYRSDTIALLAGRYGYLLNALLSAPRTKIAEIPAVSAEEEHLLLNVFNGKMRSYPLHKPMHQLFEEQVEAGCDRIAAVNTDEHITYGELNNSVNRIARLLRRLGTKRNDFVGICEERGIGFLTAILGILKAGGAYVPLDPQYPVQRIQHMVENSAIKTLITSTALMAAASARKDFFPSVRHFVLLDHSPGISASFTAPEAVGIYGRAELAKEDESNVENVNMSRDLAYMLYTSGSTGVPKGAMIRHDGAVNHIYAEFEELGLDRDMKFLQSAPASADISVWQFLAPLLAGGTTVIAGFEIACDPVRLFDLIETRRITIIEIVPAVMKELLDHVNALTEEARRLPGLKWTFVCGEVVPAPLGNLWLNRCPEAGLVNAYGPTEASDDISQYFWKQPLGSNQRSVPIGKPLANLTLYVLGSKLELMPVGVRGEICVSGVGVGPGYWQNEERTRESFVKNPYAGRNRGEIIYRTGDFGRWLPDGNLEFLGRKDHQIKLRGFRIELGEIEAEVSRYPGVKQTIALIAKNKVDDDCLVAYLSADRPADLSTDELRGFLRDKLPEYMVPAAFVVLETLPLTPVGKVDRQALADYDWSSFESRATRPPPRNDIEKKLIEIWADVIKLEREQIGIEDNFFQIGGHSLLATQIINRVKSMFNVDLPLRMLFEKGTVANMAEALSQSKSAMVKARLQSTIDAMSAEEMQALLAKKKAEKLSTLDPVISNG